MREGLMYWTVWVGFVDGKPELDALRPGGGISTDGYCIPYRTRKEAKRYYQDVRKMTLRELFSSKET